MIDIPIKGLPPKTYVCWDYYATLNPFNACNWRGLLKHGPSTMKLFEKQIRAIKRDGLLPHKLEWNHDLAIAASNYLKDLEGCRSIPDQIYDRNNFDSAHYVDELFLKYENHHRVVLMPERFPWINPLEAIFDLLLDDNYVGHPNRDALLSNDYDSIGIACNCHARFG